MTALDTAVKAQRRYEAAKQGRLDMIAAAIAAGYSYQQVGDAIGMTDAGVRQMLLRAGMIPDVYALRP